MARPVRLFQTGLVWHLTQRCHERRFLMRFARDRRRWSRWLIEARKRYGLCVLNYIATSNHVHVLVLDRGRNDITRGMQLAAGRTAQEYNQRKGRVGAFWQDRYHATAVETHTHLQRCVTYIDMNMVRAGKVAHPGDWSTSGFAEALCERQRYLVANHVALASLLGYRDVGTLRSAREQWVEEALDRPLAREPVWTESLAVGSEGFVRRAQMAFSAQGIPSQLESVANEWRLKKGSNGQIPQAKGLASD